MKKASLSKIDNTKDLMQVSGVGLATEVIDNAEVIGNYGFAHHPKSFDTDNDQGAVMVIAKSSSGQTVVSNIEDPRFRPTDLEEGEVSIYSFLNKDNPHQVKLKQDGSIEILAGTANIKILANGNITSFGAWTHIGSMQILAGAANIQVLANGNITSSGTWAHAGQLTASVDVIGDGKSLKNHTHGGVQGGGGNTSPPN